MKNYPALLILALGLAACSSRVSPSATPASNPGLTTYFSVGETHLELTPGGPPRFSLEDVSFHVGPSVPLALRSKGVRLTSGNAKLPPTGEVPLSVYAEPLSISDGQLTLGKQTYGAVKAGDRVDFASGEVLVNGLSRGKPPTATAR